MTLVNLPGQEAMTAARGRWVLVVCTIASGMAFIVWLSTILAATVLGRRTAAQGVP